jgi:hypothetical protein
MNRIALIRFVAGRTQKEYQIDNADKIKDKILKLIKKEYQKI